MTMSKIRAGVVSGFLIAAGAALTVTLAPAAAAEPGLLPQCEATEAGGGMAGGQTTVCESPGNAQIDSRPSVYPPMGAGMFPWDDGFFMM